MKMHRNRQVSLSFLFLLLSVLVTAQTSYGTIPNPPNFETAISVNDIPVDELGDYYHYLPTDQHWFGKKIENWDQFFSPSENVEIKFYYQKDLESSLISENQVPIFKTEPWFFKIQFTGFFYVVAKGNNCEVITKYWRYENGGMCQYQSFNCGKGNTSLSPTLLEYINLHYEPDPYGNFVQSSLSNYQKEPADNAIISVELEKNLNDWKLKFWSSEVQVLGFYEQDDYYSDFSSSLMNDTLIVSFNDIDELEGVLNLQEELISVLIIQQ